VVTPKWVEEVISGYDLDTTTQTIIAQLSIDAGVVPRYTLHGGLLRFKNRIWIGAHPTIQKKLLQAVRHGYPWIPTDQAHGCPRQVGPAY
jgi:hypothetical protein